MRFVTAIALLLSLLASASCGDDSKQHELSVTAEATPVNDTPTAPATGTAVSLASGPRRLAFLSDRDGPLRVYTMNADGTDIRVLSQQPVSQVPFSVSRDGTEIVVPGAPRLQDDKQPPHLYRIDVATGATRELGPLPVSDSDLLFVPPEWQSDDSAVLADNYKICYLVPTGGGDPTDLASAECGSMLSGTLSIDGRWAAIFGNALLVVNADKQISLNNKIDQVAGDLKNAGEAVLGLLGLQLFGMWRPLWSPDASEIAYLDGDAAGGQQGLAIIKPDGSDGRLLVPTDKNDGLTPSAWSDDGTELFYSGQDRGSSIGVVNVRTGNVRTLAGGDGHNYFFPRWVVDAAPPRHAAGPSNGHATADMLRADLASAPGRLVYQGGESRRGIFTATPDGKDERELTSDDAYGRSFSSNGRWLIERGKFVINTVTGERRELAYGASAISPSGKRLVYLTTSSSGEAGLATFDLETSASRTVFEGALDGEVEASWSPDESRLAFFQQFPAKLPNATGDYVLTVVNADGSSLIQLAHSESELNASGPIAWSPDGSMIAFDDQIARIVPSTGGTVRDLQAGGEAVSWSPDGRTLAVIRSPLTAVDVATGKPTHLTGDEANSGDDAAAWSPDGRWLAYLCSDRTLCVMDVATRGVVRLGIAADDVHWISP